jgi:hypothetical protein
MKPTPFNEMGRKIWQQANAPWGFSKDVGPIKCLNISTKERSKDVKKSKELNVQREEV